MIIDINATLGHYPFRQLTATDAESMTKLMDRWTIDRALVSSLHAVFYRDCHRGNLELFDQIKSHPDRFISVAMSIRSTLAGGKTLKSVSRRCT